MIKLSKQSYYHYDANLPKRAFEGNAEETKPTRADVSNETRNTKLKEEILGIKDNRPSYTEEQLESIGFNDDNACYGNYFEASSENILDMRAGGITYKHRRGLKANGKEIKTVYELLNALKNGVVVELPGLPDCQTVFVNIPNFK